MSTEAERAYEYRKEIAVVLDELCEIINRAKAEGFLITFTTGDNPDGTQVTKQLNIVRKY